ncbi:hypothetical protein D9M68_736600 [compost metagenome]
MNSTAPVPIMAAPASPQMKYSHWTARPPNFAMCRSPMTWRVREGAPPRTSPAGRRRSSSPSAENSAMPVVALMLRNVSASSFQP